MSRRSKPANHGSRGERTPTRGAYSRARPLRLEQLENRLLLAVDFTGAYTQNFDSLPTSGTAVPWTNDVTLPGWHLFRQPAPGTAITSISVGNGNSNTGAFYSFGNAGSTDRALGGVGSGGAYFGAPGNGAVAGWMALALTNSTSEMIDAIDLRFDGEQWRDGGIADPQVLKLEYGFGLTYSSVGPWFATGQMHHFQSPQASTIGARKDGDLYENRESVGGILSTYGWAPGQTLWLRWVENNDFGADHGLAIDNVSVTAVSAIPVTNLNNAGPGSLRAAIDAANASPAADTIVFSPTLHGGKINLTSGFMINASQPIHVAGPGRDLLTIDGNSTTRFFYAWTDFAISGLTLQEAFHEEFRGAAIESLDNLSVTDVAFLDNVTRSSDGGSQERDGGAAIFWEGRGTESLSIRASYFENNEAYDAHGGAIHIRVWDNAIASVERSQFVNNRAYGPLQCVGGAIYVEGSASSSITILTSYFSGNLANTTGGAFASNITATVIDSTFTGNRAPYGGAINSDAFELQVMGSRFLINEAGYDGGALNVYSAEIVGSEFIENQARLSDGGAIYAHRLAISESSFIANAATSSGGAVLVLENISVDSTTFFENNASVEGGAVYVNSPGSSSVTNSTFKSNTAGSVGGAILHVSGELDISHSTIVGNTANVSGGGLMHLSGDLDILHSTIVNNSANTGGGIYSNNTGLTIRNSILAQNNDTGGAGSQVAPDLRRNGTGTFLAEYSLIGDARGTGLAEAQPGSPDANGNLVGGAGVRLIDPRLGPLADNGGPTQTMALLIDSPAGNAGDPTITGSGLTDQRGQPRVVYGRIDMGAYEYNVPYSGPLVVSTLSDEFDLDHSSGDLSLREALYFAKERPGTDTITFSPALNDGTITVLAAGSGFRGLLIDSPVVIDGSGQITLSGGDASGIFMIDDGTEASIDVELRGMTLRDAIGVTDMGGAIFSNENLTLRRVNFIDNSVITLGGAVAALNGSLTVIESAIAGNRAGFSGGGIFTMASVPLVVENSTFSGNLAERNGGAMSVGGGLTMVGATISGNLAEEDGGGISLTGLGASVIRHSTITNNTADADDAGVGYGGGISVASGVLLLDHTIIAGNFDLSHDAPDLNDANGGATAVYSFIGTSAGSALIPTSGGVDSSGNRIGGVATTSLHYVQVDVAAMGTFDQIDDFYQFQYRIDGGPLQPLFTFGPVFIPQPQQYPMESGEIVPLFIPLGGGSVLLNNTFQTFGALIPAAAESLEIMFTGTSTSENDDDAFAFRNLRVRSGSAAGTILAASLTDADHHSQYNYAVGLDEAMPPGSMFGVRSREQFLPPAMVDDSLVTFDDQQGIIRQNDLAPFFGLVGTTNAGHGQLSATFTFDVANPNGPIHPQLGPLANNGGPTMTHAPSFGSPVINSGRSGLVAGSGAVPLFDQRGAGFSRVSGARIDVGAIEVQQAHPASADFNDDDAVDGADFLAWQRGLGATGAMATRPNGNANNDGVVNGLDLDIWKSQFGSVDLNVKATAAALILDVDESADLDADFPADALATITAAQAIDAAFASDDIAASITPPPPTTLAGRGLTPAFVRLIGHAAIAARRPLPNPRLTDRVPSIDTNIEITSTIKSQTQAAARKARLTPNHQTADADKQEVIDQISTFSPNSPSRPSRPSVHTY